MKRVCLLLSVLLGSLAPGLGSRASSVSFDCTLPADLGELAQPLVCTGSPSRGDTILIARDAARGLRLGWEHAGAGTIWSRSIQEAKRAPHKIKVRFGSDHPDQLSDSSADYPGTSVVVLLDGQVVLSASGGVYPQEAGGQRFGANLSGASSAGRPLFSGTITSVLPWDPDLAGRECVQVARWAGPEVDGQLRYPGRVAVEVLLRPGRVNRSEPIISAGVPGKADLVFIRYVDATHVAFGADHWGFGGPVSPAMESNPSRPHVILIDMDCLHAAPGRLGTRVSFDGHEVIHGSRPSYLCPLDQVYLGVNSVGASTAEARFSGQILRVSPE